MQSSLLNYQLTFSVIVVMPVVFPQLDLCEKMAKLLTRASTGSSMRFPIFWCMAGCHFTDCSSYHMGKLVNFDTWSRYYWVGSHHGWDSSSFGILFDHALVENTMAELKYVVLKIMIFFFPSSLTKNTSY